MYNRRGTMGPGMGVIMQQQRTLSYLQSGKPDLRRTSKGVLQTLNPYRWHVLGGTLLMLGTVGIGLLPPLFLRELIDSAIPKHDIRQIVLLGVFMIFIPLLGSLLGLLQNYISAVMAQSIIADLRERLYKHILSLGLDFFTWTRAGEIHSRFLNDAAALQSVLTQSFLGTLTSFVTIFCALIIMFFINWQLTLATAIALPTFALPMLYFGRRTYSATTKSQQALDHMSTLLEETISLSGALVVKSFGTAKREEQRFEQTNKEVRTTQLDQALLGQWANVAIQGLAALGPAILYTYGALLVIWHEVPLGTVVAFAAYLTQLYRPASSLANANATVMGGMALFDRIFQVLDLKPTLQEPLHPTPLPDVPTRGVEFEQVSFHYTKAADVLHEISFQAPVGQLTALVGPSGAGKSTMLSLASRLYDPSEGRILLDGVDLRQVSNTDLRQRLAVVTQEVFLFHTTLRENIGYGAPDASEEEIHAAVVAAQLQELIERLPDGLETIVGERGYRLSGGEKQRVAIARALLRQSPYLLLDEATSSLDSRAERLIQQALETLMQGRTVIAIAHRLSTIQRAEQILVVDQGRIVERGTHESLLQRSGHYRRLYQAQFVTPTQEAEALAASSSTIQG